VSRGSEEELEMIIPTGGSPTLEGRGCPTSPGEGVGICPYRRTGEAHPESRGGRGASPYSTRGDNYPLTQGGENEPPPTREVRGKEGGWEKRSQQNQPKKST